VTHTLWTSTGTSGTIAHMAAARSGLDVTPRFISLRGGEHKRPEYLAINPKGEVPALQLADGTVITEIPAIITWLADAAPASNLLPDAHPERAQALSWLAWCHFHMGREFSMAFQAARMCGGDEAAGAVLRAASVQRAAAALAHVEAQLAPDATLPGTGDAAAPRIFLAMLARFAQFLRLDPAPYPRLGALAAAVYAEPRIAAALALEAAQT
jgi:glutathione S-transferase